MICVLLLFASNCGSVGKILMKNITEFNFRIEMNFSVIGCGYVGQAVTSYFSQNLAVSVSVTTTSPEKVARLETIADQVFVVRGNDSANLESVLQNQDSVLLCVGARGGDYQQTYLQTAETLVNVLHKLSSKVQIIYTSTCAIYGNRGGETIDENSPLAPASENYRILAATEQTLLTAANHRLGVCILRLGGIYGPGRELSRIFSRVAGATLPGDGSEASNWVHLDDIVGAVAFAYQNQLQGVYNLVDDSQLCRHQIISRTLAKQGLPQVTWNSNQPSTRLHNVRVSNQKLKDAGYQLLHPQIVFN